MPSSLPMDDAIDGGSVVPSSNSAHYIDPAKTAHGLLAGH
tara:strand:+ start:775 stop:894 length:120 start_codon:yes stop_codon:yes gene_type:complete